MTPGYATILVRSEPVQGDQPALQCAADLADSMGALVIGLGVEEPTSGEIERNIPVLEADDLVARRDLAEANLRHAEAAFHEVMGSRRILWRTRRRAPHVALAEAARAADLLIVPAPQKGRPTQPLGNLLLSAGRPVLVVPESAARLRGREVIVAWNDSRESRRALADAMPLLAAAKDVLVLQVARTAEVGAAREAVADVAAYLVLRGVAARSDVIDGDPRGALEPMLERARWMGADLLVAGAYGHSRISELLLGGVTEGLLRQHDVHVLFGH